MPAAIQTLDVEQGAVFAQRFDYYAPRLVDGEVVVVAQGAVVDAPALVLYSDDAKAWLVYDPVDLTGWHARMQVRKRAASVDVLVELTDDDGHITLGGADGSIDLRLTAVETTALESGSYRYDLELIPPSGEDDVERFAEGPFVVSAEVTRAAVP